MAVCDRRHQHHDRRRVRLRERLSLLCPGRVHLGHLRRCYAAGRLEQRVQRHRRYHQHLLHDRLVERLRLRGSDRHAVARYDLGLHHRLRYLELLLHLQLPAHPLLVLRLCAAAGAHRRRLYLEQGRLDPEPRLYAGHLVHVCSGVPVLPGGVHLCDPLHARPRRRHRGLGRRAGRQRRRDRLRRLPRQEARPQSLQAGCL